MYVKGGGVEQSAEVARKWLERSAAQGCEDAIRALRHFD